jgi:hypothetical protein
MMVRTGYESTLVPAYRPSGCNAHHQRQDLDDHGHHVAQLAAERLVQRRLEVELDLARVPNGLDEEERAHADDHGDEDPVSDRPPGGLLLRGELARLHERVVGVEPIRLRVCTRACGPAWLRRGRGQQNGLPVRGRARHRGWTEEDTRLRG